MKVIPYPNGIYGATTYLVYDETTLEAAIIDCTCCVNEISKFCNKQKINVKYILITHGHFDHVYCAHEMKKAFPEAHIMINKEDVSLLDNVAVQCNMAGVDDVALPCIDGLLDENTKNLKLGGSEIKVIETRGHSKGGVCYSIDNILFSGDTLFKESIGRTDLFSGSYPEIEKSIKEKLFALGDTTTVYPGHGESTTIGHEKKYNPYFGGIS